MPSLCEADFIGKGAYHLNEHKNKHCGKTGLRMGYERPEKRKITEREAKPYGNADLGTARG